MSKENMVTATKFWGDLISKNPIVAITGVTYNPEPHGIPSKNKLIQEHDGMLLDWTFSDGVAPYFGSVYPNRISGGKDPQTFAVGAIVYVWENCEEESPFLETKAFTKYLVYERENHLKDLEQLGVKAKAIVMADIDLPVSINNLRIISETLEEKYSNTSWTLFETDNGYHVVFNKFIDPKEMPIHFAELIGSFIDLVPEVDRVKVEEIVEMLNKFYDNPEMIRLICKTILEKVSHYDDIDKKELTFPIDLRNIAHSLLELMNYLETGEGSFGFLRISDKSGSGSQPIVVAKHEFITTD